MLLLVQIFVRDKGVVSAVVVRTSENQFAPANLLGFDKFRQVLKITPAPTVGNIYFFFNALKAFIFTR
jgi:hypothetical protein